MPVMHFERSVAALRTFSDEHIERWAALYSQPELNRILRGRRVSFETFLLAPEEIIASIGRPIGIAPRRGLLPAQREVQARADMREEMERLENLARRDIFKAGARVENGRVVEKLRHTTWPRRADKRVVA